MAEAVGPAGAFGALRGLAAAVAQSGRRHRMSPGGKEPVGDSPVSGMGK